MRVKHCYAPNCSSNTDSEPGLTFHSFPSNEHILQQWAKNMDQEEKILKAPKSTQKHYFICGKHFIDSCFQTYERKKLNRGAIPTVFNETKDKHILPNLKNTNTYKGGSTKPIILNHQIVFPNVFENEEDSAQPLLQSNISDEIDSADSDVSDQMKMSIDLAELTAVQCKLDGSDCSIKNFEIKSARSVNEDVPSSRQESMKQFLSNMFEGSKGTPEKPLVKFKNESEQIKIKHSKKHIRRLLVEAKKNISILKKCEGNFMNLFNERVTIFNSKVLRNLGKVDDMPPVIRTYMNHQSRTFHKTKSFKYKKHQIPFYAALYNSNKSAYQFLSKIFHFPSSRKIHCFLKNMKFESGLNALLFDYLKRNANHRNPLDRYCTLLFKEVRLCPCLSYNCETDTIEGLQMHGSERTCNIVNRCFMFFLSGLHKAWRQPIAYYFVSNLTNSLHICIKEVISEIHEKTDFLVVASVSSMDTVNLKAIESLMDVDSSDFVYQVYNHEIIHIFDPPTLLKQLRNHFIDHDIVYDDNRVAKWRFLDELLKLDGFDGAIKLTKLTNDHVNPTKEQKRKTVLAAQLFSSTVSSCLRIITRLAVNDNFDTADFCLFVNHLFDSFNAPFISKYKKYKVTGRLTDSSSHFEFWNEAQTTLSSLKFINRKSGKIYTSYVAQAFIININNVKKLWTTLRKEGFKYLITKYLNLDSLENFHSTMQHFYGKYSKYPTSVQFQESFKITLFNNKLIYPHSDCDYDSLTPQIFYTINGSSSPPSNMRLFSSVMYKMVKSVQLYSAENIVKFLAKNVLNYKCDICVQVFFKDYLRMIVADDLMLQINLLQREVYKNITKYLNQQFIKMLYCFADEIWSFDFVCLKHKSEMKYKTVISICFIMAKCFIEITNKMLIKQLTKK